MIGTLRRVFSDVFRFDIGADPFGFVDGVGQFDVFTFGQSHGDGRGCERGHAEH